VRQRAALFAYLANRKDEHPRTYLKTLTGVIHADVGACPQTGRGPNEGADFNEPSAGNRITEAGCWSHIPRKLAATGSPIAAEALDRIDQLHCVEEAIKGFLPEHRR
jgi:hypothetical protein